MYASQNYLLTIAVLFFLIASGLPAEEKAPPDTSPKTSGKTQESGPEKPTKDRRKLSRKVSFAFVNVPMQEAVTFLQTIAKVGIILDPRIATAGAAQRKITLRVTDMPFDEALDKLCERAGLVWDTRGPVYITSRDNQNTTVELEIYDVKDLVGPHALAKQTRELKPNVWVDATTSIEEQGGKLVVMQTPAVHKEIQAYLAKLRVQRAAATATGIRKADR